MKILIVPGVNALSHFIKSVSIKKYFEKNGHIVQIAVSKQYSNVALQFNENCFIIPNIQESDYSSFPTLNWFKDEANISSCITAERELLKSYKPDIVIGIFNFTIKASTQLENIPFYSLSCTCMLSKSKTVLGFNQKDSGFEIQKNYLDSFFCYITAKMNKVMEKFKLPQICDIRECLEGITTFLWDFPEFMQSNKYSNVMYIGPIPMVSLNSDKIIDLNINYKRKFAVISFGTCTYSSEIIQRMIRILTSMNLFVVIIGGYQNNNNCVCKTDKNAIYLNHAPLSMILENASFIISHGGQMTIFESILEKVPSLIIPFQPEQDHNGLCLENIMCGERFFKPTPFNSLPQYYISKFNSLSQDTIISKISSLVKNEEVKNSLSRYSKILKNYDSLQIINSVLENL